MNDGLFQPKAVLCSFCGERFVPGKYKYRQKWHDCLQSLNARDKIQKEKQKVYDRYARPMLRGREKRSRKSGYSDRHFVFLAEGAKLYPCKSQVSSDCWKMSANRFNCPSCLEKLENLDDIGLDVLGFSTLDSPDISL